MDSEMIAEQQQRLSIYRRTLAHCLDQRARLTTAYIPPSIVHEIEQTRDHIRRIKQVLRAANAEVADHPDDEELEDDLVTTSGSRIRARNYHVTEAELFGRNSLLEVLGLIRTNRLVEAANQLTQLEDMISKFTTETSLRIIYDRACVESLLAETVIDRSNDYDVHLSRALEYLVRWISFGLSGQWRETGSASYTEIYRMGRDDDLHHLLVKKRTVILQIIPPDLRPAFPKRLPRKQDGGGGCVPMGSFIHTPQGLVRVENVREGTQTLSVDLRNPPEVISAYVVQVHYSRSAQVLCLNNQFVCTLDQPLFVRELGWMQARSIIPGMHVLDEKLQYQYVSNLEKVKDYINVFNLTINHRSNNYIANGVVCHNKHRHRWE